MTNRFLRVQLNVATLNPLTITERYEHEMGLIRIMDAAGVRQRERLHIIEDGFESVDELISHYANDVKGFSSYLTNLNKTFASARAAADKVYFTPPVLAKFVGIVHYMNQAVNTFHKIPDVGQVDQAHILSASAHYKTVNENDDDDEDKSSDVKIPTLKGNDNWIDFRDSFKTKLSLTIGNRGISIDYVIDSTPRAVTSANDTKEEIDDLNDLNLEDDEIFKTQSTHFGPAFKADNAIVWNRLKALLINTPHFNHISQCEKSRNGRNAWNALKGYFEGSQFHHRSMDRAFYTLTHTFYTGEHTKFKFEKYVNKHKEAHKLLLDAEYNQGAGLDDATKIRHFEYGIKPEAGLEIALTQMRSQPQNYQDFTDLVTFLSGEVQMKKRRIETIKSTNSRRQVSGFHKGGKGDKGGKSKSNGDTDVKSSVVDGKTVYARHYPPNDYKLLTTNQRKSVANMRKGTGKRGESTNRKVSASQIDEVASLREDLADMQQSIIAGVTAASNSNSGGANSEITDDEHSNTPSSTSKKKRAQSGSVGGFIANRRKRE